MCKITLKCGMILIVCLSLQTLVLSADFAGGTGEANDPYQIATAKQLISINSDYDLMSKHFILVNNIDLDPNLPDGRIFTDALISQDKKDDGYWGSPFRGVFDGQGHTIANLHIDGQPGYNAGLFGMLDGLVMNLHLTDVVVSGSPCGAIAGMNGDGMILRCSVTGQISGHEDVGGLAGGNGFGSLVECRALVKVTGGDKVGGIVGGNSGTLMHCNVQVEVVGQQDVGGLAGNAHGRIIECIATGAVVGSNNVGGLIGDSRGSIILRSSAICDVTAEETAGGLAGKATWFFGGMFSDCYFQGSVAGSTVGGLIGEVMELQVFNCYAACEILALGTKGRDPVFGGLFGDTRTTSWAPLTAACFWDAELSGIDISTGSYPLELGTGLTTEQMLDEEVYRNAGWDFSRDWMICEGCYPKLRWEVEDCNDL
ncbi:MAG: hypothetical protein GY774_25310 [Planctomycetes bacterium]|nr:hypothetical protein [Planctomycetota bacterium]